MNAEGTGSERPGSDRPESNRPELDGPASIESNALGFDPTRATRPRLIRVRGLRDNPDLGARLVAHLRRYPKVRVRASVHTGRLRIEGPATAAVLEAVLTTVRALETPRAASEWAAMAPLVEEDTTYPPNRRSLVQSGVRLVGAASGLLALGVKGPTGRRRVVPR